MPLLPPISVPANATLEELAGIVGKLNKTVSWLSGTLDKVYVQQQGYAGQNLARDHGFEMVPATGSVDAYQTFGIDVDYLDNPYWWMLTGTPRIRSIYDTSGVLPYSLFGLQGAIVNSTNYFYQQPDILVDVPNGPYCLSAYAAPKGDNTPGAGIGCALVIRAFNSTGVELGSVSRTFTISESYSSSDNGKWSRGFVTYKDVPDTAAYLEVQVKSDSAEWIEVDGVQLVPKEMPEVYSPENQLWAHARSQKGAWHYRLQEVGVMTLINYVAGIPYVGYIAPGQGSMNKTILGAADGIEHNTAFDGSGTLMYACNAEGKNYAPWVQLQDGAVTTAPAVGALRSSTGVLQIYDGVAWQTIATQAWVVANSAAPMNTATSTLHTHAR